jgi:protein-L-isoaspartate(D-aspartate) O-methyltransferase
MDFKGARRQMVDNQIRTHDVTEYRVVDAFAVVPRELFVPDALKAFAYIDENLLVKSATGGHPARFMMKPAPFAKLVQLAEIVESDKVLVIGCDTGYSAAIVGQLAGSVVALDCEPDLVATARAALAAVDADNVEVVEGLLEAGWSAGAPYDVILIVGGIEELPTAVTDQLAPEGRLVAVDGEGLAGQATLYRRAGGEVSGRPVFNCPARLLPGFRKAPAFIF